MDDIAAHLRISKKTLYQHFENKAAIVHAYGERHFAGEIQRVDDITREAADPIHAVLLVVEASGKSLRELPAHLVYDIQKYYPRTWELFHAFKNDYALRVVRENILAGQAAGLYRQDLDPELAAHMRLSQIDASLNILFFPPEKFDHAKVQVEQLMLFLHGIVSLKGKRLLYQYLQFPEDA